MKSSKYNNQFNFGKTLDAVFDILDSNLGSFVGSDFFINAPSANIIETEKGYEINLAAPGLEKSDFNINLEEEILSVEVKKEKEERPNSDKFLRREFNYSSFKRNFTLPEDVDKQHIKANYENGVLIINLLKKESQKGFSTKINVN